MAVNDNGLCQVSNLFIHLEVMLIKLQSQQESQIQKKLLMVQKNLTIQLLWVMVILLLPQIFRVGLLKASVVSMIYMSLLIKKENWILESTLRTNLFGIV